MVTKSSEGRPRRGRGSHTHGWVAGPCRTCRSWCPGCSRCGCDVDAEFGRRVRANHAAAQVVHEGRAHGGPRDGIKLKASARWDGRLANHFDGYYAWVDNEWQWIETKIPKPRRGAQEPQARVKGEK